MQIRLNDNRLRYLSRASLSQRYPAAEINDCALVAVLHCGVMALGSTKILDFSDALLLRQTEQETCCFHSG